MGAPQHIGAEIGRGGFAVVFQALNVETGDFVAVKRFPLSTVDEESLASIQVRELGGFGPLCDVSMTKFWLCRAKWS